MGETALNMKVRLRRQVLVNTGNYTNCIADAEVELEGFHPSEYAEKYDILGDILSNTLQLEALKVLSQQTVLNTIPYDKLKKVYENGKAEEVEKDIAQLCQKLL